jgi:hypothetical protein
MHELGNHVWKARTSAPFILDDQGNCVQGGSLFQQRLESMSAQGSTQKNASEGFDGISRSRFGLV